MSNKKKVVIFGGGSGLSQLLKGIIQFPWDVTAVVSVSDNGGSTGELRREFNISAVGDFTKVMMAMSARSDDVKDLFSYRFDKSSSLHGHSIKNLIMTALLEMKGDYAHSLPVLAEILDVKGQILPVTEDNVELIGFDNQGRTIFGEEQITKSPLTIKGLGYSAPVSATPGVLSAIQDADLIVFSSGSLLTSILPNLIIPEVVKAIEESPAPALYISNMLTQPGETDGFAVSDHIRMLENYLKPGTIHAVIANNAKIPKDGIVLVRSEGKDQVPVDEEVLKEMGIDVIADNLVILEDGYIRHNAMKTAYLLFSYLMDHPRDEN